MLTLAVAAGAGLAVPVPASAHTGLAGSEPSDGQRVDALPREVVLHFTEPVSSLGAALHVTDPLGREVPGNSAELSGSTVTFLLSTVEVDGPYTVAWRVVAADGHPGSGRFSFTVGSGSQGLLSADAHHHSWLARHRTHVVVIGLVLLLSVGYLAFDARKRRQEGPR